MGLTPDPPHVCEGLASPDQETALEKVEPRNVDAIMESATCGKRNFNDVTSPLHERLPEVSYFAKFWRLVLKLAYVQTVCTRHFSPFSNAWVRGYTLGNCFCVRVVPIASKFSLMIQQRQR